MREPIETLRDAVDCLERNDFVVRDWSSDRQTVVCVDDDTLYNVMIRVAKMPNAPHRYRFAVPYEALIDIRFVIFWAPHEEKTLIVPASFFAGLYNKNKEIVTIEKKRMVMNLNFDQFGAQVCRVCSDSKKAARGSIDQKIISQYAYPAR